jgi:hypothetical protein
MQNANAEIMINKMTRHFNDWSKRSLSLLGKIQIIKTFGISQYLYTLAIINLNNSNWKEIRKLIYKFIWNRNMHAAPAPHRIKKDVMLTPVEKGGFGMVDLESVTKSSRIKRFTYLMEHNVHPIADLQHILCLTDTMSPVPRVGIDDVTTTVVETLYKHYTHTLNTAPAYVMDTDVNLQCILLNSKICSICLKNKRRSRELATLTHRGIVFVQNAILSRDDSMTLLSSILSPTMNVHVTTIYNIYRHTPLPDYNNVIYLYDYNRMSMIRASQLSSRNIRQIIEPTHYLNITKLLNLSVDDSVTVFKKVSVIKSIQSKNKMLRLMHGDVYCGARLKRFNLSDNDRCIRCFEEETIQHLLLECPYTLDIWHKLGMQPTSLNNILLNTNKVNLEIISQFISEIVFRKKVLPTDVLIRTIYTSFATGCATIKKSSTRPN